MGYVVLHSSAARCARLASYVHLRIFNSVPLWPEIVYFMYYVGFW